MARISTILGSLGYLPVKKVRQKQAGVFNEKQSQTVTAQ